MCRHTIEKVDYSPQMFLVCCTACNISKIYHSKLWIIRHPEGLAKAQAPDNQHFLWHIHYISWSIINDYFGVRKCLFNHQARWQPVTILDTCQVKFLDSTEVVAKKLNMYTFIHKRLVKYNNIHFSIILFHLDVVIRKGDILWTKNANWLENAQCVARVFRPNRSRFPIGQ